MMKNILMLLTLGMVLSASKCNDAPKMDLSSLNNAKLLLQSLNGKAISMPDVAEKPFIMLNSDDKSLTGFGGCNQMFGNFEQAGADMSFTNIGSTKKFCEGTMDTENGLKGALNAAKTATFKGGILKLMDGTKELAAFKKEG